ncbi:MAG TPA: glycosyltransferase [Guyparkeria sp.]|nr:glycosyltransferase [Guyparkeria sp.]
MSRLSRKFTPQRLKVAFYLTLGAILLLVGYRVYLSFFEPTYHAVHAEQIERIQARAADDLHFAVVGNINNSVGLFERKMIPMLNRANLDFVVSAGNAVSGGGEDKYRALYRTLSHLNAPYLLTVGEKESGALGSYNYYKHFGPYFFGFRAGSNQFLFLDSSDPATYPFQLHWLKEQLRDPSPTHRFVFIGHPMYRAKKESPLDFDDQYLADTDFRDQLHALFREHAVDAVFSSNLRLFDQQSRDGVRYVVTGGAGGLVLNDETSFYHYVDVRTDGDQVQIDVKPLDIGQYRIFKTIESLWFMLHSLFYVGHLNFLLVLGLLTLLAIKLYSAIFVERDYYRNYDLDTSPWHDQPLKVAMVTNNFLPFIGGVPISIDRLRRGLEHLSHRVRIIAPSYADQDQQDRDVVRIPSWFSMGRHREFRLANPFSPRIRRELKAFAPDIIHIHHPFWLGWTALKRARRLQVPTIFTYHTRLEHYSHYVPLPGPLFRNLIAHAAVRRFANHCTGVIVPTESAQEYLRVIGVVSPIYVHPTGIDFNHFQTVDELATNALRKRYGIRPEERVLVSVSRLSQEKNIDFLIAALDELRQRSTQPFRCLIIGTGGERGRLQERIDALGLSRTVTLVGGVPPDEMARYYQLGDAFVFASKSETQGMVILEAMAAGLPVVAVRSSGIDDVVKHEVNGFKTVEDIGQWTTAARCLLEDDALRAAMAEQAVVTARRHDINHFAADVADSYRQVLALHRWQKRWSN